GSAASRGRVGGGKNDTHEGVELPGQGRTRSWAEGICIQARLRAGMRDARHMERRGVSGSTGRWRGAPGPAPRTGPASGARQGPAPTHRDYRTFQGRPRTGRADAYGFPQRFRGASWVGARRLRLVAVDQVAGPALGA